MQGRAEIVEISSRLVPCGLVILLLENGETYKINPFEGIAFPNGTDTVPPTAAGFNGASSWQGALPTTAVAKIHVRYDRSLKDMFDGSESKARQKVLAIIHLARPRFKRSLGLSMNIEIEIQSIQYYNSRLPHAHSSGALRSLSGRGEEEVTQLLGSELLKATLQLALHTCKDSAMENQDLSLTCGVALTTMPEVLCSLPTSSATTWACSTTFTTRIVVGIKI